MYLIFPSFLATIVFVVFYSFSYFLEIINQTFVAIKNRRVPIKAKADKLSLLGIDFVGALNVYIAVAFGLIKINTGFGSMPIWVFYIGMSLMFMGEAIRQWSYYSLGKFFTGPLVIMKDHKLIIKGPYRFVRHPAYFGGLIIMLGLGIAVQSWAAGLACLATISLAYSYRIFLEERALRKEFGKLYAEYSRKTPMIIPLIL
jgi:protein-S-isoprenylcysteine O-methyltransferase Ste14